MRQKKTSKLNWIFPIENTSKHKRIPGNTVYNNIEPRVGKRERDR